MPIWHSCGLSFLSLSPCFLLLACVCHRDVLVVQNWVCYLGGTFCNSVPHSFPRCSSRSWGAIRVLAAFLCLLYLRLFWRYFRPLLPRFLRWTLLFLFECFYLSPTHFSFIGVRVPIHRPSSGVSAIGFIRGPYHLLSAPFHDFVPKFVPGGPSSIFYPLVFGSVASYGPRSYLCLPMSVFCHLPVSNVALLF